MTTNPPRWSSSDLETARQFSRQRFVEERLREPLELYLTHFEAAQQVFEDLLEKTIDLTLLHQEKSERVRLELQDIVLDERLFRAFRYVAGPPISEDDLKAIADAAISRKALQQHPSILDRLSSTVLEALDRRRFPWVREGREASVAERTAAVLASAALMAMRRTETERRHEGKNSQEAQVQQALLTAGFKQVPQRTMSNLTQTPDKGEFCLESKLAGRKADLIVGLWDGRVMPIECKVSNSYTNSVKRLNNDAAAKASGWLHDFGHLNIVPCAVLSGLYKLHNLDDAQLRGLTLFWAHDLDKLIEWVAAPKLQ